MILQEQASNHRQTTRSAIAKSLFVLTTIFAAQSCGPARFTDPPPAPAMSAQLDAVVYLIGDAGYATPESPVIRQLHSDVLEVPAEAEIAVVFLGDNIYWSGLHEPSHPSHPADVAHLEAQIDVVRGTAARGIFIPGNHDWGYKGERGMAQIRRQGDYLAAAARQGAKVAMLPPAGCPGPTTVPLAQSVLLVAIETDLWIRDDAPAEGCPNPSTDEALASLSDILSSNEYGDDRHVVVLGHHPLKTYGPHGGYFGLKDQFFPGTKLWAPLYIPLPFVYPIVRNSGITRQDLSHSRYRWMIEQFAAVFNESADRPLVWAAGHDHNLQVFRAGEIGVEYVLVSGAGSDFTNVGQDEALFAAGKQHGEHGYMRLEFFRDGTALLSVITDGTAACDNDEPCAGEATVRYWRRLAGE
ncbi:MAG: hypothetical protein PVJ43_02010 [Gemmatimonadales bacterium]|jgi:hypothetical protein